MEGKIQCLELIDEKVVGPMKEFLDQTGEDYKMMIVPDHPTPLEIRTHSSEPVPFVLYDSRKDTHQEENQYSEAAGAKGTYFDSGWQLADYFFSN